MKYFLLFSLFICFSCSEKQEKGVSMDELISPSSRYKEDSKGDTTGKILEVNDYDSLSLFSIRLIDSLHIIHSKVVRNNTELFPDRFHPVKSEKWSGLTQNDSIRYAHWKFKDSIVAEQTFFNWLDVFGPKRIAFKIGDKVRLSSDGVLILLQDRSIVLYETRNILNLKQVLTLFNQLGFGKHWEYCILQQKSKKTEWIDCITDTSTCLMSLKSIDNKKK
jgi:hypothetical protein